MNHKAGWDITIFIFILFSVAPLIAQNLVRVDLVPAEIVTEEGLRKITFDSPAGFIKVYLPDDIARGDTISGSVGTEPKGKSGQERSENQALLNGYVIDFGDGNRVQADRRRFTWTPQISKPSSTARYVVKIIEVLGQNGKPVSSASVPVNSKVPIVPSSFKFPVLAQTGRPIVIKGPFDGDASNTTCSIAGTSLPVIAESRRKAICTSPVTVVGVTDIKISQGSKVTTRQIRNIGINLSAPKTTLDKGEDTELRVQVIGLEGITSPIQIQMITTGAVNTQGGNTQTIQIEPSMVDPNGVSIQTFTLNAVRSGNFNVTASVQTAMQRKP